MTQALRLWRIFRVEDAILFVWLALVEPLTFGGGRDGLDALTRHDVAIGLVWTSAAGLAILAIATREPDEPTMEWMTRETPHAYAPFPLMIGIAVLAGLGVQKADVAPPEAGLLPALGLTVLAYVFYSSLPSAPAGIRRALLLPMAVSGSGVLSRLTLGLMNETDADAWLTNGLSIGVFFAFCSAVFYLTFVVAPTAITERSGRWSEWTIRYLVYVATLSIGVVWLRGMN